MNVIFCSSERLGYAIFKNYNLGPYLGPQNQEFTWYVTVPHVIFCRFLRSKMEFGAPGPQIGPQIHINVTDRFFGYFSTFFNFIIPL